MERAVIALLALNNGLLSGMKKVRKADRGLGAEQSSVTPLLRLDLTIWCNPGVDLLAGCGESQTKTQLN